MSTSAIPDELRGVEAESFDAVQMLSWLAHARLRIEEAGGPASQLGGQWARVVRVLGEELSVSGQDMSQMTRAELVEQLEDAGALDDDDDDYDGESEEVVPSHTGLECICAALCDEWRALKREQEEQHRKEAEAAQARFPKGSQMLAPKGKLRASIPEGKPGMPGFLSPHDVLAASCVVTASEVFAEASKVDTKEGAVLLNLQTLAHECCAKQRFSRVRVGDLRQHLNEAQVKALQVRKAGAETDARGADAEDAARARQVAQDASSLLEAPRFVLAESIDETDAAQEEDVEETEDEEKEEDDESKEEEDEMENADADRENDGSARTVWMCFVGDAEQSDSWWAEGGMEDLQQPGPEQQQQPSMFVHGACWRRVLAVQDVLLSLVELHESKPRCRVVLCGRGVHGSVAQLAARLCMQMLSEYGSAAKEPRVAAVAFGAPPFAEQSFCEAAMNTRWCSRLVNVVHEDDLAPALLGWSASHALSENAPSQHRDFLQALLSGIHTRDSLFDIKAAGSGLLVADMERWGSWPREDFPKCLFAGGLVLELQSGANSKPKCRWGKGFVKAAWAEQFRTACALVTQGRGVISLGPSPSDFHAAVLESLPAGAASDELDAVLPGNERQCWPEVELKLESVKVTVHSESGVVRVHLLGSRNMHLTRRGALLDTAGSVCPWRPATMRFTQTHNDELEFEGPVDADAESAEDESALGMRVEVVTPFGRVGVDVAEEEVEAQVHVAKAALDSGTPCSQQRAVSKPDYLKSVKMLQRALVQGISQAIETMRQSRDGDDESVSARAARAVKESPILGCLFALVESCLDDAGPDQFRDHIVSVVEASGENGRADGALHQVIASGSVELEALGVVHAALCQPPTVAYDPGVYSKSCSFKEKAVGHYIAAVSGANVCVGGAAASALAAGAAITLFSNPAGWAGLVGGAAAWGLVWNSPLAAIASYATWEYMFSRGHALDTADNPYLATLRFFAKSLRCSCDDTPFGPGFEDRVHEAVSAIGSSNPAVTSIRDRNTSWADAVASWANLDRKGLQDVFNFAENAENDVQSPLLGDLNAESMRGMLQFVWRAMRLRELRQCMGNVINVAFAGRKKVGKSTAAFSIFGLPSKLFPDAGNLTSTVRTRSVLLAAEPEEPEVRLYDFPAMDEPAQEYLEREKEEIASRCIPSFFVAVLPAVRPFEMAEDRELVKELHANDVPFVVLLSQADRLNREDLTAEEIKKLKRSVQEQFGLDSGVLLYSAKPEEATPEKQGLLKQAGVLGCGPELDIADALAKAVYNSLKMQACTTLEYVRDAFHGRYRDNEELDRLVDEAQKEKQV